MMNEWDNYNMQGMDMYNQGMQGMDMYNQGMQGMDMYNQGMQGMNMYNQGMQGMNMYNQGMQGMDMYNQGMYKPVRYTKSQILQGLRDYVIYNTGVPISAEEKLEEEPTTLRHACAQTEDGVTILAPLDFCVPEMGIQFKFYFCTACGKLYYPKDFMM